MKEFGCPPRFPSPEETAASGKADVDDDHETIIKDKTRGKKVRQSDPSNILNYVQAAEKCWKSQIT